MKLQREIWQIWWIASSDVTRVSQSVLKTASGKLKVLVPYLKWQINEGLRRCHCTTRFHRRSPWSSLPGQVGRSIDAMCSDGLKPFFSDTDDVFLSSVIPVSPLELENQNRNAVEFEDTVQSPLFAFVFDHRVTVWITSVVKVSL